MSDVRRPRYIVTTGIIVLGLAVWLAQPRANRGTPAPGVPAAAPSSPAPQPTTLPTTRPSPVDLSDLSRAIEDKALNDLRVPAVPWYRERVDNIKSESLPEMVAHLANFDDQHLATNVNVFSCPADVSEQARHVTRLMRVRRLLEEGQTQPQEVCRLLRQALAEVNANWLTVYPEDRKARLQQYEAGRRGESLLKFGRSEPDAHDKATAQALAACYVLGELNDSQALPVLAETLSLNDMTHDPPRPPAPAPPAMLMYAIHKLIANYPVDNLTPQAKALRDEYLRETTPLLPPQRGVYGVAWDSGRDESDPRLALMDPQRLSLQGQRRVKLEVYPHYFTNNEEISTRTGGASPRLVEIFGKQREFIAATLPPRP